MAKCNPDLYEVELALKELETARLFGAVSNLWDRGLEKEHL